MAIFGITIFRDILNFRMTLFLNPEVKMLVRTLSRIADFLLRPHYGLRWVGELMLSAFFIRALSCDDFRALGISKASGWSLVVFTYLWMFHSLVFGRKDGRPDRFYPWLVVGRCMLTVIMDVFLLFLSYVAVVRMLSNGPEFFADEISIPDGVDYSVCHKNLDRDFRVCGMATNCAPFVVLTSDYPQVCYGAVNPGEPGEIWIRVHEITTWYCLGDFDPYYEPYKWRSERACRWSEKDGECFLFWFLSPLSHGRRSRPYIVSVELLFQPDSNRVLRTLISRNFLVRGKY